MDISPTIIVGGGIAGLAAALALGKRDCLILEQAPAFANVGAGLQLGPNAVRALQKLGAWEAVESITSSPPEIHMRDGVSGKLLKRLILGENFINRFGAPYRVAHRADLHSALLKVVKANPQTRIELGQAVSDIETHIDGLIIHANGKAHRTPAAIIADGVNSQIRQQHFPSTAAISAGATFHRATVPLPTISGIDFENVNVWLYPQGHVVHYPVGTAQQLNIIAITPDGTTPLQHFEQAAAPLVSLLQSTAPLFTPWPGLYVPPLTNWVKGNMLLLGDAAHATLPYLAQGAAMSLEDAACLSNVLPTTNSIKHAFSETAFRRKHRTRKLHFASLAAGKTYHMEGMQRLARNAVLHLMPASVIQTRLKWIYSYER